MATTIETNRRHVYGVGLVCTICGKPNCEHPVRPEQKVNAFTIQTEDGKVAISSCSSKAYEIGPNLPQVRKEWKSRTGAEKALDRIIKINPMGASILGVHEN